VAAAAAINRFEKRIKPIETMAANADWSKDRPTLGAARQFGERGVSIDLKQLVGPKRHERHQQIQES
jgi:hypothetical protein